MDVNLSTVACDTAIVQRSLLATAPYLANDKRANN